MVVLIDLIHDWIKIDSLAKAMEARNATGFRVSKAEPRPRYSAVL